MKLQPLQGRVALATCATEGIGLGIARVLAEAGDSVGELHRQEESPRAEVWTG
jgi:NAD(P)-dependent dehydrogenase (short-subunit alcohol dehydrogenase family)